MDQKLLSLHLVMMCCLDLLLVDRDSDHGLTLSFFRIILYQLELSDILLLIDFLHAQCRHADVDWDHGLHPISY